MRLAFIAVLSVALFQPASAWMRVYDWFGSTGYSVQETSDKGYIVTGRIPSADTVPFDYNLLLMKTDSLGDTIWTRAYGREGNDEGRCVRQTKDGGYIIVGSVDGVEYSPGRLWLLKTDANGDTAWTKRYGYGFGEDEGYWVEEIPDSGYIISGMCNPTGGMYNRLWLLRTDDKGDTMWTCSYSCSGSVGHFVQRVESGYIVAGSTGMMRTDMDGDTIWTYPWTGGGGIQPAWLQMAVMFLLLRHGAVLDEGMFS